MSAPVCIGCGEWVSEGLSICGQSLCRECEAKIVKSGAGKIDYQHWMDCCRAFWENIRIDLSETDE